MMGTGAGGRVGQQPASLKWPEKKEEKEEKKKAVAVWVEEKGEGEEEGVWSGDESGTDDCIPVAWGVRK